MENSNKIQASTVKSFNTACRFLSSSLGGLNAPIQACTEGLDFNVFEESHIKWATQHMNSEAHRLSNLDKKGTESQNLFNFLVQNKFKFSLEILEQIKDNHVVEVYASNFIALYRNTNFYKSTSYNLDQLHLYTWPELFKRDQEITDKIALKFAIAFDAPLNTVIDFDINTHFIQENFSKNRVKGELSPGVGIPVELNNETRAVIRTNTIIKLYNS